jgi:AcrR family transcriptional regulator
MNNRDSLLEHALELFASRGYEAVGVQEICEAAGVTKPTLYHYHGSKRGLLEALLAGRYAPFAAQLERAAAYNGDLPRTLEAVAGDCFAFAEREPSVCRMMLLLWNASPTTESGETFRAHREAQERVMEELFASAAADHGNMRGRQRVYALTFLGMIHTYLGLASREGLRLDAPVVRRAVHQFSHGIYS